MVDGESADRGNALGAFAGQGAFGATNGIEWKPALNAALIVAVPAAILCSGVFPLGLVAIVGGSAWAVGQYARRVRQTNLSTGTGVRIGLLTGLFAGWLTFSFAGLAVWILRFVLHQGDEVDSIWATQLEKNQQILAQMGTPDAQAIHNAQRVQAFMTSAEGRAGLTLFGLVFFAAILVVLAVTGGALGAKLVTLRRQPEA